MERSRETGRERGIVAGMVLVVAGGVVLAARQAGFELGNVVDDGGWPTVHHRARPRAARRLHSCRSRLMASGSPVAGSVVTAVGLILLYQETTENWESWAYAWALIPTAAGIGITGYGLLTGHRDIARTGIRLAAAAGVLFLVGSWYFTTMFETGQNPIDVGSWLPVVVIGIGALVLGRAVLTPSARGGPQPPTPRSMEVIDHDHLVRHQPDG